MGDNCEKHSPRSTCIDCGQCYECHDELQAKIAEQAAEIASLHVGLKRVSDYNGRIEYQLAEQIKNRTAFKGRFYNFLEVDDER
jgi:hypothetical protein